LKPLDYEQGAPLGFLLAQKTLITLLGSGELALRLLPFLAGYALLIVSALWLKRFLSAPGWLLALALIAVSPTLVYYSAENKQYMLDAALTLMILWLATRRLPLPAFHFPLLTLLGAVGLWFSHPLIFTLAAVGLTGLIFECSHDWRAWLVTIAVWLASFGLLYAVSLRGLAQNDFLLTFWQDFFLPIPPTTSWLAKQFNDMFASFSAAGLGLQTPLWFNLLGIFTGILWLGMRQPRVMVQIGLIFAAALAASALRKYPFGGRMVLFLLPLVAALLGASMDALYKIVRRLAGNIPAGLLTVALGVVFVFAPVQASAEPLIHPYMHEDISQALSALRQARQPEDAVYIYPAASPAFLYYAPRYGFALEDFVVGDYLQGQSNIKQIRADLQPLQNAPRLWILFAHVYAEGDFNEMQAALNFLRPVWRCKTHTRASGTGVTLTLCVKR